MLDQQGNAEADTAADLGRRHQSEVLIDARRRLLKARSYWYLIMFQLHSFMIAVARVSVNHDGKGGTAPDPLVWDGHCSTKPFYHLQEIISEIRGAELFFELIKNVLEKNPSRDFFF